MIPSIHNTHVYTVRVAAGTDIEALDLLARYIRAGIAHKEPLETAEPQVMNHVIVSQRRYLEMLLEEGLIEPHDIEPGRYRLTEEGRRKNMAHLS